jgi:hypothetical protein
MIKVISTELAYFFTILVVLALLFHGDLLTSPLSRLERMDQIGNYWHPFLWASVLYVLIGIVRLIVKGINKLKNRKSKN